MKRRFTLGSALVFGVLVAALVSPYSRAEAPGTDGRIAYMVKDQADHWQIWVASPDLSGAKKLTHGRYDSGWPVWSPHGTRIAFDSGRSDHTPNNSHHVNDIFVMKADGSGVKKLTDSKGVSENAAWSPKGSLIAFDRGRRIDRTAIYVMPAHGGKPRRVTTPRPPLNDYSPRFSPDGTHLVFTRKRGTADYARAAIFTVRLDGSGLHRLTPFSERAGQADWSPDGKQIVFDANPDPRAFGNVYVMDAAGGKAVNLTQNPVANAGSDSAVWSPDGSKILFVDNRYVNGVGTTGLATMNPDGSGRRFLASRSVDAGEPDWGPTTTSAQPHALVRPNVQNGPLTIFSSPNDDIAHIVTASGEKTLWQCPTKAFCGAAVSFAWAPDGRRVAFTLDEIGGTSPYVGFRVVNVVSGRDIRIPGGAPRTATTNDDRPAWDAWFKKMERRVGCWPAANLAWSPDGSSIAYNCGTQINVLRLRGSGYSSVPTGSPALWPTWSPSGTRVAYSTQLKPQKESAIYTVGLDGSHRRLLATGGAAPAWSPDGRTIAYETVCGIRLFTLSTGRDTRLNAHEKECRTGPPAWSPDGTKLAIETSHGAVYEMDTSGKALRRMRGEGEPTWYGALPGRPSWRGFAAASARPKPGHYTGTTSEGGTVTFRVADHGKRVTGFMTVDGYNNKCHYTGAPPHIFQYTVKVPLMKAVKSSGSFTGTAKATVGPFTGTFRVKGRFSSGKAHGTVTRVKETCGSGASNPTTSDYLETFTAKLM